MEVAKHMYREIAGPTIELIAGVEEVKVTNLPLYVTHVCCMFSWTHQNAKELC